MRELMNMSYCLLLLSVWLIQFCYFIMTASETDSITTKPKSSTISKRFICRCYCKCTCYSLNSCWNCTFTSGTVVSDVDSGLRISQLCKNYSDGIFSNSCSSFVFNNLYTPAAINPPAIGATQ